MADERISFPMLSYMARAPDVSDEELGAAFRLWCTQEGYEKGSAGTGPASTEPENA